MSHALSNPPHAQSNTISLLQQALANAPAETAKLPAPVYAQLLAQADALQAFAKQVREHFEQANELRFGAQAQSLRQAQQRDFATVRLTDGAHAVVCEVRKIVDWDQAQLQVLAAKITAAGEDPTQYVEISYKVAESKYKAWPDALKSQFSPARTERPGKASYHLELASSGVAAQKGGA
jgi:hypothetical protein